MATHYTILPRDSGLFSNINGVVNHFVHTVTTDDSVTVDWRADSFAQPPVHFTYYDCATDNVWDYLFVPLDGGPRDRDVTIQNADAGGRFFGPSAYWGVSGEPLFHGCQLWRHHAHAAWSQYIRVKDDVWWLVDSVPDTADAIGVHYRHPGHHVEQVRRYDLNSFFRVIDAMEQRQIFLATDYAPAMDAFVERYGNRVFTRNDVLRSAGNGQLHIGHRPCRQLAVDVLVDALLLSRCAALVHIISNIATAVGYINPNIPMIYLHGNSQQSAQ